MQILEHSRDFDEGHVVLDVSEFDKSVPRNNKVVYNSFIDKNSFTKSPYQVRFKPEGVTVKDQEKGGSLLEAGPDLSPKNPTGEPGERTPL